MVVTIKRLEETSDGTIGVLSINDRVTCFTLEPPMLNNEVDISCIPIGMYRCGQSLSPKYGLTYMVLDVPGRSNILFHAGNILSNTRGCILLGLEVGHLGPLRAVLKSKVAMLKFTDMLQGEMLFDLYISNS